MAAQESAVMSFEANGAYDSALFDHGATVSRFSGEAHPRR